MDYIKVIDYQLTIINNQEIKRIDQPFFSFMNNQLLSYLTTLKTQEKILKKIFGFKNKLPIIVNHHSIFLCVISYRCNHAFYINYFEISFWEKYGKEVIITFIDQYCMRLKSHHSFMNQIKKIDSILSNIDKIKIIQ